MSASEIMLFLLIIILILLALFVTFLVLFIIKNINIKQLNKRLESWSKVSYHIDDAGDKVFNGLPIGIIVYDDTNTIKWINEFVKNTIDIKLIEEPLDVLDKSIYSFIKSNETTTLININDKYFKVMRFDSTILYLFDDTESINIVKKLKGSLVSIGQISVNNLEESLAKFDNQTKTNITANIKNEITSYLSNYKCFFEFIDDDSISFVTNKKNLEKMVADKFSILSKVREITNDKILTLSIGVACFDDEYSEIAILANSANILAEKRGGDQAVVNIQGEKILYIGGSTNAVEKDSFVACRMQTLRLKEAIEDSSNVIVIAHDMADCDALGSLICAYKIAKSSINDVKICLEEDRLETTSKKMYEYAKEINLDFVNDVLTESEAINRIYQNTLLIIVDTQSPTLLMFKSLYDKSKRIAVIDHHRPQDVSYTNEVVSYIETYSSSTVELITEMTMFYGNKINITKDEATIMLAGIVVDTNNFTMRTGSRTFDVASLLKEYGADMLVVKKFLRDSLDEEKIIAKAFLESNIFNERFAITKLDITLPNRTILAKISERLLTIDNVEASFTIAKLTDNVIAISARSIDSINVQLIMEELGGGGHLQSAATQINDKSIDEVYDMLCFILKRDFDVKGELQMKVILLENVKGKGSKNDIIEVNNGYGNYLISNNLAVIADDVNLKNLEKELKQEEQDKEERRKILLKLKQDIESHKVTIYLKLGADGKAFGHITSKQICDEFEMQNGIKLDKRKIDFKDEINNVGIYSVSINLDKDVVATFEVNVVGK